MTNLSRHMLFASGLAACCLLFAACGRQQAVPAEQAHLANLARAYGTYISQHQGRTPPNEATFKSFLKGLTEQQREARGIKGDLDTIFISPRDNQPYVVRYNLKSAGVPSPFKSENQEVIAYEKTGSGNRHHVAYSTTQVEEIDNAKLKQLVPGA